MNDDGRWRWTMPTPRRMIEWIGVTVAAGIALTMLLLAANIVYRAWTA